MEFEKKTDKFSFGAGSLKTAGTGKLSEAEPVQKTGTPDKKKIAKAAAVAAASTAVFLLKRKLKHK